MHRIEIPSLESVLPGRSREMTVAEVHSVNGNPVKPPFPDEMEQGIFAMGCFWGAERRFWQQKGVFVTAVGYAGGFTPNPTYDEVCTGLTGHCEVVLVVYDPRITPYWDLLKIFWLSHDPTQGMRQGNDTGTQYRSALFCDSEVQFHQALDSKTAYQKALAAAGYGHITTQVERKTVFYYAEDYHQQYLAKNPAGYCNLKGTGVDFASGTNG